ncbi:SdbA protein, substrate of the Dot/Icm system [Legionella beliardensis]|uniref:SdbA protein, substrate of the Dot/Icm system n=1 Tax=Legionella beliardensis TaxID=91822 RepID=A0A378HXR6_9GAMM|nr:alpha/beta hydrolase fold domain-containing protein [Legionella beliardensis]STX27689.1 SdbA protein, substrate of the Dot/Icm system [Legionella beliardensis]
MKSPKLTLQQSESKYGGFYRLVKPKKTFIKQLGQFALDVLKLPYTLYQLIMGRLLSNLVINPLFRKEEKNDSLLLQNPKRPDPLFTPLDEMNVINVLPKKNILLRELLNWKNYLVNHTTTIKIIFWLLSWITHFFPKFKAEQYIDHYLDKLVNYVELKVQGEGKTFKPEQIHFRGLEQLSEAQQEHLYQKLEDRIGYDFRQNRNHIYFYKLQTPDNAVLDSVEVRSQHAIHQDITNRHFIVAAMPRSNNFVDWIKHYQIYAKQLDVTIIAFNYRGIGLSKGIVKSENDLYDDAYAQVQRLLQLGAQPKNIAVMGECLGGNVAAHTAGKLHQEGDPVKLYPARSFRSLTSIISGRSRPTKTDHPLNPLTWLKWVRFAMVQCILNPIIISSGWSLNVDKQFLAVPPHDRDFIVVRSKKDNEGNHFADDKMVPYEQASLYSLVKEKRQAIMAKQKCGEEISPEEEEWLENLKHHKFYVSENLHDNASNANGHTVHPRLLVPTYQSCADANSLDGRQYTINFFKRVWPTQEEPEEEQLALNMN